MTQQPSNQPDTLQLARRKQGRHGLMLSDLVVTLAIGGLVGFLVLPFIPTPPWAPFMLAFFQIAVVMVAMLLAMGVLVLVLRRVDMAGAQHEAKVDTALRDAKNKEMQDRIDAAKASGAFDRWTRPDA